MLKIEVIKFEAQDVITASGVCACANLKHQELAGVLCVPAANGVAWVECKCECHE